MRKILIATLAVSTLASASIASAATFTTTGTIEKLNMLANTVQLSDGDSFKLPSGTDLSGVSAGQKVQINWSSQTPSWFTDHVNNKDVAQFDANSISVAQ